MNVPKIVEMGVEHAYEDFPGSGALSLDDHFKPVRLSERAIDEASKVVPIDLWIKVGIHTWLKQRAEHVFSKLSSDQTRGTLGKLTYQFMYDAEGPVLQYVKLG